MRKHHLSLASVFVIAAHIGIIYALTLMKKPTATIITPPVLKAAIIAITPEIEKPAEPIKTPPAPKQPTAKPKPKTVATPQPKKIIAVEQAAAETTNTLAVAATPEPLPTPEPVAAPEPVFTAPRIDAKNKDNPPPVYPRIARRLGQEGVVLLEIQILANGSVGDIKLKKTSGFARLDEAAIAAAKSWHYLPATQDGKAITFWYEHSVKFVLN